MVPFQKDSCFKAVGVKIKEHSCLSRDSLAVLFSVAEQPIALIPSWHLYYSTTKPRQGKDFHFRFLISPSPTIKEIIHCTSSSHHHHHCGHCHEGVLLSPIQGDEDWSGSQHHCPSPKVIYIFNNNIIDNNSNRNNNKKPITITTSSLS